MAVHANSAATTKAQYFMWSPLRLVGYCATDKQESAGGGEDKMTPRIHSVATTGRALPGIIVVIVIMVAILGVATFDHAAGAQSRGNAATPNYRVAPFWPQPFP